MSTRRVVYTCLFGGYETLLPQPVAAGAGIDFVALTDDPDLRSEGWTMRFVPPRLAADSTRSSRRAKILAHVYLPDYDESLYVDNTVLLLTPAEQVFAELLPPDVPLALPVHSYRGPVRDEFEAVVAERREIDIVCAEQLDHYARTATATLDLRTLWTGILLRRHRDPALVDAMTLWWEHVLRYSRRDQLSLPYVLATTGLPHHVHHLDNFASPYHQWPRPGVDRNPAAIPAEDIAAALRAPLPVDAA